MSNLPYLHAAPLRSMSSNSDGQRSLERQTSLTISSPCSNRDERPQPNRHLGLALHIRSVSIVPRTYPGDKQQNHHALANPPSRNQPYPKQGESNSIFELMTKPSTTGHVTLPSIQKVSSRMIRTVNHCSGVMQSRRTRHGSNHSHHKPSFVAATLADPTRPTPSRK